MRSGPYRERCDDEPRTRPQVLVAVDVSSQGHSGQAGVLVQVPVVAELPLPLKVRDCVHLHGGESELLIADGDAAWWFCRVRAEHRTTLHVWVM